MITNVTIPALQCSCEAILKNGNPCKHVWISTAVLPPVCCANPECRSREWNGRKEKRKPAAKPKVVLPKSVRVRQVEVEEDF